MNDFIEELRKEGLVKKVHYIANIEKQDLVPDFVTAPGWSGMPDCYTGSDKQWT